VKGNGRGERDSETKGEDMPSSRTSITAIVGLSEGDRARSRAERVEGDIRGRVPMVVIIGDVEDVFRISKSP
jgi:hypothetical protein